MQFLQIICVTVHRQISDLNPTLVIDTPSVVLTILCKVCLIVAFLHVIVNIFVERRCQFIFIIGM